MHANCRKEWLLNDLPDCRNLLYGPCLGTISGIRNDTERGTFMTAIFSSSALKTNQREIKDAALKEVVHITENGNGAFVFCSEEIFENAIQRAAEEAAYEERLKFAIESGRRDFEEGRCIEGIDAFFEEVGRRRHAHGQN